MITRGQARLLLAALGVYETTLDAASPAWAKLAGTRDDLTKIAEGADTTVARMYNVASDGEAEGLDDLLIRAGVLWRCAAQVSFGTGVSTVACGCDNPESSIVCDECGAERPS